MSVAAIIQGTQAQHWARGNACTYNNINIPCNWFAIDRYVLISQDRGRRYGDLGETPLNYRHYSKTRLWIIYAWPLIFKRVSLKIMYLIVS